ncbi:MAG: hypothetical protein ACYC6L_13455, partial [Anaerolineae bacterium]
MRRLQMIAMCCAPLLMVLLLASAPLAMADPFTEVSLSPANPEATIDRFKLYLVWPAEPSVMVVVQAQAGLLPPKITAEDLQKQRNELGSELARLQAAGLAGEYAFDEVSAAYRVELSDPAFRELMVNHLVSSIERDIVTNDATPGELLPYQIDPQAVSGVYSVIFAQVHSPLVWGNTNLPGLAVQLVLEDSTGAIKGVPAGLSTPSLTCQALPNCVNVDPNTLFFETTFVDPGNSKQYVSILPGDKIRVITSGDDPGTPGEDPPEDKRVPIVAIDACASLEQDRVEGTTIPNAQVIVTFGSLTLRSGYLTPGSGMTYSEQTSDGSGRFVAATFRTTADPTYKLTNIVQGSKGFARVRVLGDSGLPTGDEVWTIWGQNVFILENSSVMHGYAYSIPGAPSGLASGIAAPRPATTATVQLKEPGGAVKASWTKTNPNGQYNATFDSEIIYPGDSVQVTIQYGDNVAFDQTVLSLPISAAVNLAANQVTGVGPANTLMVIGAGNVQGYVTKSSTYDAFEARVTSDGSGLYASGKISCGSSNYLELKPG